MNFSEVSNVTKADEGHNKGLVRHTNFELPLYAHILQYIEIYGGTICFAIGIILNTLIFIIFTKWKPSAITLHLSFLAVADTVTLLGTIAVRSAAWGRTKLNIPVFLTENTMICRFSAYLMGAGALFSSLILASTTVERFLCVAFPLRVKSWNLVQKSKILLIFYTIVSFGTTMLHFFSLDIITNPNGYKSCKIHKNKMTYKYLRIGLIINSTCGAIIFVLTLLIPILLFRQKRARTTLGSDSNSKREFRVTVMLLTVTCLFIILKFPLSIIQEIYLFITQMRLLLALWSVAFLCLFINHSTNFFVYFIFLESFRSTFYQMFSCIKCVSLFKKRTEEPQSTCEINTIDTPVVNPSVEQIEIRSQAKTEHQVDVLG